MHYVYMKVLTKTKNSIRALNSKQCVTSRVAQPSCLSCSIMLQTDQAASSNNNSDSNPTLAVGSEKSHAWILLAPPVSWINCLSR